jgi:putative copper export protein
MGAAGVLYFVGWSTTLRSASHRALRLSRILAGVAVILLVAHLVAWLVNGAPAHVLDTEWSRRALGTRQGTLELVRIGLALVALWAVGLARRPRIAASFAFAALAVSGALGHPAAMLPAASVPAKALHLLASALWLGGLLWLVTMPVDDAVRFGREAERVSGIALAAVIVVGLSGAAQSLIFLPSVGALLSTTYGLIVLAKIGGLGALVAFGAHHRFRGLPALSAELAAGGVEITSGGGVRLTALRRTVWREVVVMAIVIALGGLLAYVSPNVAEHAAAMTMPSSR